jgi:S-ribosylhomocysteine lyase LuxS involved in autoinducer biosynthesis
MERIAEIQNCEKMLLQAIKENDIVLLDNLLHRGLPFVNPMGQMITKTMDMANYTSGQVTIEYIESSEQNIHVIDNTAVVAVNIKLKGKYLEHILDESFQYLRVWMQQEDSWKIIGGSGIKI